LLLKGADFFAALSKSFFAKWGFNMVFHGWQFFPRAMKRWLGSAVSSLLLLT
jgi:hypothetical protein